MKVRISYTVNVSDRMRRALRAYYGESGLATREEVANHYRSHGGTLDDHLLYEYAQEQGKEAEEGQEE